VVIFVVGMTVLLLGVALLVLPGPAVVVIPAGLAILGLEFRWARRWMRRARAVIRSGERRLFGSGVRRVDAPVLYEGDKEQPNAGEEQPETAFGNGQDHPQPNQQGKKQVNANCSQ
jgi:tellurite resistance protein TerC